MADVTLDELYKSLQAADAAGDKPAAQKLADYIRMLSAMPPGTDINKTTGAPVGVRAAVGAATTGEDKLTTIRKFFPDAQQYDKDNFIYTDPKTKRPTLMNENNPVFFGSEFNGDDWMSEINNYPGQIYFEPSSHSRVAELINEGKVVGLFYGKTEYGPRALGNRSIVTRPTDTKTHVLLNQKLRRNEIMPFAPSVLKEHINTIFHADRSLYAAEFMTLCYDTRKEWVDKIPAVIHPKDKTARPQAVDKNNNPNFHSIITEYYKLSDIPVVLNTSFNAHGEPINNYPNQVIKHLLEGCVDYIATEHFIFSKL